MVLLQSRVNWLVKLNVRRTKWRESMRCSADYFYEWIHSTSRTTFFLGMKYFVFLVWGKCWAIDGAVTCCFYTTKETTWCHERKKKLFRTIQGKGKKKHLNNSSVFISRRNFHHCINHILYDDDDDYIIIIISLLWYYNNLNRNINCK